MEPADIILSGGKIITADARFSIAQSVAIRAGRFIAVGEDTMVQRHAAPVSSRAKGAPLRSGMSVSARSAPAAGRRDRACCVTRAMFCIRAGMSRKMRPLICCRR